MERENVHGRVCFSDQFAYLFDQMREVTRFTLDVKFVTAGENVFRHMGNRDFVGTSVLLCN